MAFSIVFVHLVCQNCLRWMEEVQFIEYILILGWCVVVHGRTNQKCTGVLANHPSVSFSWVTGRSQAMERVITTSASTDTETTTAWSLFQKGSLNHLFLSWRPWPPMNRRVIMNSILEVTIFLLMKKKICERDWGWMNESFSEQWVSDLFTLLNNNSQFWSNLSLDVNEARTQGSGVLMVNHQDPGLPARREKVHRPGTA